MNTYTHECTDKRLDTCCPELQLRETADPIPRLQQYRPPQRIALAVWVFGSNGTEHSSRSPALETSLIH